MFDNLEALLTHAIKLHASDVHLTVGSPVIFRINSELIKADEEKLTAENTNNFAKQCLDNEKYQSLLAQGEVDSSLSIHGLARIRVNAFRQRGCIAIALRVLNSKIPDIQDLNLPPAVDKICELREGLVLVTGPTGSGKSTTLAALINRINQTRSLHILTLEDPIEYLHRHNKSIVNQREIGHDSKCYSNALRAALREDPDVILIGEMRDLETISTAITAAETGHLVLSTLHTLGAAKTIDRLIDVFPPHQQQQIRVQISMALKAVISQRLIPNAEGTGRIAAIEFMTVTPAISNLIREGKTANINMSIQTGGTMGMQLLDKAIADMYLQRKINYEDALQYCSDKDNLRRFLNAV